MKIITSQSLANGVYARWEEQYDGYTFVDGEKKKTIMQSLKNLQAPVDPEEVNRIIGNTSWTTPPSCDVCGKFNGPVIEVGEEPDYESNTAYICLDCVQSVVRLAEEHKAGRHEHG